MSKILILISILFVFVALIGCSKLAKNKENNLVGSWNQVIPLTSEPVIEENWIFAEGNMVIAKTVKADTAISDTGAYSVKYKGGRAYIVVENLDYWLNGTYLVLKQNKEMLLLQRIEAEFPGAFYRREFIKK